MHGSYDTACTDEMRGRKEGRLHSARARTPVPRASPPSPASKLPTSFITRYLHEIILGCLEYWNVRTRYLVVSPSNAIFLFPRFLEHLQYLALGVLY